MNIFGFDLFNIFGIKDFTYDMLASILENVLSISADICLIAGLVGIILHLFGWKKFKNAAMITWAINLLIQVIGGIVLYA